MNCDSTSSECLINMKSENETSRVAVADIIISGMETSSSDTASENSPTTTMSLNATSNLQVSYDDSFDNDLNTSGSSLADVVAEIPNLQNRRVSFPKCDSKLVTGYLEPADPWEYFSSTTNSAELTEIYIQSCERHDTQPIEYVLNHLQTLDMSKKSRHPSFSLRNHKLSPNDCETLEEIFKRVHYEQLDFSMCDLNEISASALFEIIEYYEATTELDISENPRILIRGWQSCIFMVKRSRELQVLTARGNPMSHQTAINLGNSLNQSSLHTIKLEHCGLKGKPITELCMILRKNSTLKELWLACNDLTEVDAENLAELLKSNGYIQFLDISNNNINDYGLKKIVIALMHQTLNLDLYTNDDTFTADSNIKFPNVTPVTVPSEKDYSSELDATSQNAKTLNVGRSMLDTLLSQKSEPDSETLSIDDIRSNESIMQSQANLKLNNAVGIYTNSEYDHAQHQQQNDIKQIHLNQETENSNLECCNNDTTKFNSHLPTKAVDVNKNKNSIEIDANSADSAFESSSEGDKKATTLLITPVVIATTENPPPSPITLSSVTPATTPVQTTSPVDLSTLTCDSVTQFSCKGINNSHTTANERLKSHSSDSLSSDNSLDGCDTAFSKDVRAHLAKNDTLTRQKPHVECETTTNIKPRGLRALILWNNNITRESGDVISDLLRTTTSLELLNIGKNCLSNEFVLKVRDNLRENTTLTNLGLQSAHLSCDGVRFLASVLQFGGNCTLQRIDIRENHIQVECLNILMDALKSNKSVTRIDIDDVPKRISDPGSDLQFHYSRALHTVRSLCSRNEKNQQQILIDLQTANKKCENPKQRQGYFNSRKISLTCQSITNPTNILESNQRATSTIKNNSTNNKLDIKRKSGIRLRSPLPSPPTSSPSTSPVPSPSKSRFQVFRVTEDNNCFFPSNVTNISPTAKTKPVIYVNSMPTNQPPPPGQVTVRKSRFHVTKVETDHQKTLNDQSRPLINTNNTINIKEDLIKTNISTNLVQSKCINTSTAKVDINIDSSGDSIKKIGEHNEEMKKTFTSNELATESLVNTCTIDIVDSNSFNPIQTYPTTISNKCDQNSIEDTNQNKYENKILKTVDTPAIGDMKMSNIEDIGVTCLQSKQNQFEFDFDTDNESYENIEYLPNVQQADKKRKTSIQTSHPSTVDKLLSLFHNPFQNITTATAATTIDPNQKLITSTTTITTTNSMITTSNTQSLVPLRKLSSPNLFSSWYKYKSDSKSSSDINAIPVAIELDPQQLHQPQLGVEISENAVTTTTTTTTTIIATPDNTVSNNKQTSFFDVATKQFKDFADFGRQIFKQNVNFVTVMSTKANAGPSNANPNQNCPLNTVHPTTVLIENTIAASDANINNKPNTKTEFKNNDGDLLTESVSTIKYNCDSNIDVVTAVNNINFNLTDTHLNDCNIVNSNNFPLNITNIILTSDHHPNTITSTSNTTSFSTSQTIQQTSKYSDNICCNSVASDSIVVANTAVTSSKFCLSDLNITAASQNFNLDPNIKSFNDNINSSGSSGDNIEGDLYST